MRTVKCTCTCTPCNLCIFKTRQPSLLELTASQRSIAIPFDIRRQFPQTRLCRYCVPICTITNKGHYEFRNVLLFFIIILFVYIIFSPMQVHPEPVDYVSVSFSDLLASQPNVQVLWFVWFSSFLAFSLHTFLYKIGLL